MRISKSTFLASLCTRVALRCQEFLYVRNSSEEHLRSICDYGRDYSREQNRARFGNRASRCFAGRRVRDGSLCKMLSYNRLIEPERYVA